MSTENIVYRRCTCDTCGKRQNTNLSCSLPKDWGNIKIDSRTLDLCDICFTKVCVYINSLRKQEDK